MKPMLPLPRRKPLELPARCECRIDDRSGLVAAGHDVVRAALAFPDASDAFILATAVAEDRVLITADRDFGRLVFQHGAEQPPAIIYIRFEPDEVTDVVPRLLPLLDDPELKGHLTVVGHENTRRRPFPAKS